MTSAAPSSKAVVKSVVATVQREGAGFLVRRPLGRGKFSIEETDPFLMLDELPPTDYKPGAFAGAPWHPHRGFDTVMYIKEGQGAHHDSMGNSGVLRAGDCQWMTAGSGIIHDEGKDHPGGVLHGFQMWINLPKAHKMDPPKYQDIKSSEIPVLTKAGMKAKVIAGEAEGVQSVIKPIQPVQYIDFMFDPSFEGEYLHCIPKEMDTAIVYVYQGQGLIHDRIVRSGEAVLLSPEGDAVKFGRSPTNLGEGWSCLLMAGQKIKEPVAWRGPFVMNTDEEVDQAWEEYHNGTFCKHTPVMVA